jgi:hypothetical protein
MFRYADIPNFYVCSITSEYDAFISNNTLSTKQ